MAVFVKCYPYVFFKCGSQTFSFPKEILCSSILDQFEVILLNRSKVMAVFETHYPYISIYYYKQVMRGLKESIL